MRKLWEDAFLRALAKTGKVQYAADVAGIDRTTAYYHRRRNRHFRRRWDGAITLCQEGRTRSAIIAHGL